MRNGCWTTYIRIRDRLGIEYGTDVTSTGGSGDSAPIDPDFAGLFRPEDIAPPPPPGPAPEPVPSAPSTEPEREPSPAPAAEEPAAPVIAEPSVDTGRLFRSQGVVGHDEAVLALASDHFGRLRTLERRRDGEPGAAGPVEALPESDPVPAPADSGVVDPEPEAAHADPILPPEAAAVTGRRSQRSARGITGGAVYLIVIGVTVLVAFANALLADGDIGWPTGLALLASSAYAALTVRREDDTVAIIVPPIAFLVASLTAGQLFLGSAEGSLVNRAVVVFFSLADNWVWIIGATVAALVIVLVRRRRA
jgi:hypothetical protein